MDTFAALKKKEKLYNGRLLFGNVELVMALDTISKCYI